MLLGAPLADPVDMSLFRKALLTVFLVSLTGSAFGAGTFATFSASTTNAGSTFATGTIVLSNQKEAETACVSTGANAIIGDDDTDNAFGCTSLFSVNLKKPGDTATVDLTLQNVGTLDAATLEVFRSADCASASAGGTYTGSADMCANTRILIEEYGEAARSTIVHCYYGGSIGAGQNCTSSGTHTLRTFSTAYTAAGGGTSLALGGLDATETRYFRITLLVDSSAPNAVQGRQATFGFTWRIDQ